MTAAYTEQPSDVIASRAAAFGSEGKTFADALAAIRRRRWPAIAVAIVILAVALTAAALWPATYRSAGTILIEQQELPADLVQSTVTSFADQRIQVIGQRVMTTDNLLRVALLHFSQERMGRVLTALRNHARFGLAMALAAESDVWKKRADFAARRVRDDDWLFEKFSDCCHV